MKNFSKILFGFGTMLAMASCASEEVVNPATTDLTVTVATESALTSRALATVEGYELKCVMQLLDDNGATIGAQAVESAAAGKASFIIKAADLDAGASTALFWAEYVPTAAGAKVYDSADLTKISYTVTTFDMADASLMAAADAFAGSLTTLTNGASVTLTRPMIQFNFAPKNPEAAAGATSLNVTYTAPSSYNILTGNCDAAAGQALVYNNAAFEPVVKGNWFSSFIFAPANMAKLDQPVTMTIGGGVSKTLTIEANTLPLDANYIVNTTGELTEGGGDQTLDVTVNVGVNGDFENEPKPATFEVGAYVDAAGKPTTDKEAAAGIVYYVGAYGEDVPTNYPSQYNGKTIKGYAVALENVSATRLSCGAEAYGNIFESNEKTTTNGTQTTPYMLEKLAGAPVIDAYNTWVAAHALATENVSDWYIPVKNQIYDFISMLYPHGGSATDAEAATGTDAFKALFPMSSILDQEKTVMYISSTVNTASEPDFSMVRINIADGNVTFAQTAALGLVKQTNRPVLCRPMFTIFE